MQKDQNLKNRRFIALFMLLTIFRAQTILFIPKVQMFGGIAPNGWLGPWASDFLIGLFVPIAVYAALKMRGRRIWGFLLIYNAVGAFDYSQGLVAQYVSPMPEQMAPYAAVFFGIALFMVFQLIALGQLFRKDVMENFFSEAL